MPTSNLDETFGTGGIVITGIGPGDDKAYSVAIQSDGKIVVVGSSYDSNTNNDVTTVRYNTDGNLDTTFGTGGVVTTPIVNDTDIARSVAIQSDGKIVVSGFYYYNNNQSKSISIVRYDTNGSLDTTFGTNGIVQEQLSSYFFYSVVLQSDDKIVVAGYKYLSTTTSNFAVFRYNTNGTLDTSFGPDGNGQVTTSWTVNPSSSDNKAYSVAIQSDGKIVVVGTTNEPDVHVFAIARYNTDGTLDTSFGTDGNGKVKINSINGVAYSVVIQSDGKIVVAGWATYDATRLKDFTIVRFNSDGTLDTTFGPDENGKVKIDFTLSGNPVSNDEALSVAIQSDGKIVIAGASYITTTSDFTVARLNTNGSLDTTFGTGGKITTEFSGNDDWAISVAIQSDGKIVVAGYSNNGTNYDFAVVRYISTVLSNNSSSSSSSSSSNSSNKNLLIILYSRQISNRIYKPIIKSSSRSSGAGTACGAGAGCGGGK